jgi:hypothetical protein
MMTRFRVGGTANLSRLGIDAGHVEWMHASAQPPLSGRLETGSGIGWRAARPQLFHSPTRTTLELGGFSRYALRATGRGINSGVQMKLSFGSSSGLVGLTTWLLVGCGPSAMRTGPALALPSGPARGPCERVGWYEAAPTRVTAEGETAGVFFRTHYTQDFHGLGLFRLGQQKPEELEDVWPKLAEAPLQQKHEPPIERVDAAFRHSLYWALGGLGGMAVGIGGAIAVNNSNRGVATTLGISGLVAGLVGSVGALIAQPSGADQLQADARRRLFIEEEDDFEAVRRGVERSNVNTRNQCAH